MANCSSNKVISESEYTKEGLALWLNNMPERSEVHFKENLERTPIFAGYVFVLSMNGVISYEMDKIEEAQRMLKELERRCTDNGSGWINSVRSKLFGHSNTSGGNRIGNTKCSPLVREIEAQIILADTFLSSAILTFLTQDITGLMRGSWLLRKSWKIYQTTYNQLYDLFIINFPNDACVPPVPFNHNHPPISRSRSEFSFRQRNSNRRSLARTTNLFSFSVQNKPSNIPSPNQVNQHTKDIDEALSCDYSNKSSNSSYCDSIQSKMPLKSLSECNIDDVSQNIDTTNSLPAEQNHEIPTKKPSKCNLSLDLANSIPLTTKKQLFNRPEPLTCPSPASSHNSHHNNNHHPINKYIEPEHIKRLMGAVSFGYGIFQLSASLLPISLLRVISFFGFEGNRSMGIACLMYSRLSTDMRAPLATLALLWFYTFGSQMLKYEDGYTSDEAISAANLITESEREFTNSAIFLFFRGRVDRMKANTVAAEQSYQLAYRYSAQKELRLLCMHEIAWCKLIQLDFKNAMNRFNELREISTYSKAFYTYMTAICQGATGCYVNLPTFKSELVEIIGRPKQKPNHIAVFVDHRISLFPSDVGESAAHNPFYWRYLVYEVLFLWCALSNASPADLNTIITECMISSTDTTIEPMIGLTKLIVGGALVSLKNYQAATKAYRESIEAREKQIDEFMHVAAFAHYELAMLLLQCNIDYTEDAKQLLRDARAFKNYDLENRLSVHIQKELKKLV